MNEGFVVSDKNRRAVFVEVWSGETDIDRIVKKHRLIPQAATRALKELEEQGIVARSHHKDGGVHLSEEGKRLAADLKRKDLIE